MGRSSTGVAWTSGVAACLLFAGAVFTGLRVPAEVTMDRFPARAGLDYDATFGSPVAPLREGFVRGALGEDGEFPAGRRVSALGPARAPRTASDPFGLPRVEDSHLFVNDDMDAARRIERIPFTGRTNASTSTREQGEPTDCASSGGTAWYRYRSPTDRELIANTFGTNHAVSLAVYEAEDLTSESCDTDLSGNAFTQFTAVRGVSYLFQITSRTSGSRLVFSLEPAGITERISETPRGEAGESFSQDPDISADGRYVAFESNSQLTTSGNDAEDPLRLPTVHIYLADRDSGTLQSVSISSAGEAATEGTASGDPAMSGDGRYIAFWSSADNLVADDTNQADDVFVHDVWTGRTDRVSISSTGEQLAPVIDNASVTGPAISDDGRFVAFTSTAMNLVEGDTNDLPDVFLRDRLLGTTERVSISSTGRQAEVADDVIGEDLEGRQDAMLAAPAISPDGRYVAFVSLATNLVDGDGNDAADVFVRDRWKGTTEIASVSSTGEQGAADAVRPSISSDGRYVAFLSGASGLVEGDENEADDVFVHDRLSERTVRANVSSSGEEADRDSYDPRIARNGRYVAFTSIATTLAPGNRQGIAGESCEKAYLFLSCPEDLYVHDILTSTTLRIPVAPEGATASSVRGPALSADGGMVAFMAGFADCITACSQIFVHVRHRSAT